MASPYPRLWLPLLIRAQGLALQLLLLLLLRGLPQIQGTPSAGGDSSAEDESLGKEDLFNEEGPPGLETESREENPLPEDLPTPEAPQAPSDNAHKDHEGKWLSALETWLPGSSGSSHSTPGVIWGIPGLSSAFPLSSTELGGGVGKQRKGIEGEVGRKRWACREEVAGGEGAKCGKQKCRWREMRV